MKPKGVKKPCVFFLPNNPHPCPLTAYSYNPVLGEFFRCRYDYSNNTQGFYIAEQGIRGLPTLVVDADEMVTALF